MGASRSTPTERKRPQGSTEEPPYGLLGSIAGDGSEGERRVRSVCAKALAINLGDAAKLAKRVRLAHFDEASGGPRRRPWIMRILYIL